MTPLSTRYLVRLATKRAVKETVGRQSAAVKQLAEVMTWRGLTLIHIDHEALRMGAEKSGLDGGWNAVVRDRDGRDRDVCGYNLMDLAINVGELKAEL